MSHLKKGFTLIELLVVIAIIGILSGVVIVSLGSARDKADDAAIKADLSGIRTSAELFRDGNNNSYGGTGASSCTVGVFADTKITQAIDAIEAAAGVAPTCYAATSTYSISAPLKGGGHFCVDSNGSATTTAAATDDTDCNL
jgi:prepilin-type N-terminal cleavage/methylation domain-containing protein